jgi:hypothetical protein
MSIKSEAFWFHRQNPETTKADAAQYARANHPAHVSQFVQTWSAQRRKAIERDVESFRRANPSAKEQAAISYAREKYYSDDDVMTFRSIFKSGKPSVTQLEKDVERNWPEKDEDAPENEDD